ncbi:hypothetical protein [Neisseria sp. Ec49-e6-T10]|uniref:hypothetical protein n=1 Tax=Neisseria sp. Ec49-e6-T10 TaxID=3140744 RepID=UPI003EB9E9E2
MPHKIATIISTCLLMLMLVGCQMSHFDYMSQHLRIWQQVSLMADDLLGGQMSESFNHALQARHDLSSFTKNLQQEQQVISQLRAQLNSLTEKMPTNAHNVQYKLLAYVDAYEKILQIYIKASQLPDHYTDAQLAPLLSQLEKALNQYDQATLALLDAQQEYKELIHYQDK